MSQRNKDQVEAKLKLKYYGIQLMIVVIVLVFATLGWLSMNRNTGSSGMAMTADPKTLQITSFKAYRNSEEAPIEEENLFAALLPGDKIRIVMKISKVSQKRDFEVKSGIIGITGQEVVGTNGEKFNMTEFYTITDRKYTIGNAATTVDGEVKLAETEDLVLFAPVMWTGTEDIIYEFVLNFSNPHTDVLGKNALSQKEMSFENIYAAVAD